MLFIHPSDSKCSCNRRAYGAAVNQAKFRTTELEKSARRHRRLSLLWQDPATSFRGSRTVHILIKAPLMAVCRSP